LRFHLWFGIFITLYAALNYYIGLRGSQLLVTRLGLLNIKVYLLLFALLVLSSIIGAIGQKFLPAFLRNTLSQLGFYWIAAMVYFFLFIVLIDLVRILDSPVSLLRPIRNNPVFVSTLGILIILFVTGLLTYGTWHARNIKIVSYSIHIAKQAGSIKRLHIVMISDLHLSDIGEQRQQNIINMVNLLNPDLVVVPGDIVPLENSWQMILLRKIQSKYGVYASLGNHDYYSGDMARRIQWLHQAGIKVLRDSGVEVAGSFYLIGRDDKSYEMISGKKRCKVENLAAGVNRAKPLILLDHQPVDLKAAKDAGIDLQLSGHTHKGQFFPFNLITKRVFQIDYGYLKMGTLQVIVSSGAGTWGPPIRIGSCSEVVSIMVDFE
jgi:predicted MPP superfamily phosphohydrolase